MDLQRSIKQEDIMKTRLENRNGKNNEQYQVWQHHNREQSTVYKWLRTESDPYHPEVR